MPRKLITTAGLAVAFLVTACVLFEDRLARLTTPDFAALTVETGCTGGAEFIEAATRGLDSPTAALIVEGVKTACALRANREPISARVYDRPLDGFCADTSPIGPRDATPGIRVAFNASHLRVCEDRP